MADISISALYPAGLPVKHRRGLERIAERVAATCAVEGRGGDLLTRVYLSGLWHGYQLAERQPADPVA